MLTAMAAVAQSITSATIIYTFNGEQKRLVCPASGLDVVDLSGTVAENFKIDAITVQTNGTINDLKILVANYKSGDDPEKIDKIPLSQRDDTWYLMIGDDEGWIVQNNDHSTATRYFSFYFVANEGNDSIPYNNGGSYYSIRYKTEGKGGGGGEGGETGGNITFYDKNTATLSLGMTGGWSSDITYTYAGNGSRDISDQPGGVSSLEISGFTLRLQRASADLEIESVSLQYKVYEEGSDGQWNTLNYDFQEDEGGNILAKKYTGTTSTQGLTKGLKEGPTYILEVKYQVVDKNGNYYFLPSGGNDLYRFSVNGGGGGSGESVRGDLNGDGEVNMQDVMFLVNKIVNGKFPDEK